MSGMDIFSDPMPRPDETGASATITVEIVIDSYPSLVAQRGGRGEPLDAVQDAVEATLSELPELIEELSAAITRQYPVRMYLLEDDDEE